MSTRRWEEEPAGDSLAHAVGVLRRRWLVVALAVVVGALAGGIYQTTRTESYESTANVAFGISSLTSQALQISSGSGVPERDAATNVLIARSPEVAAGAARQLGLSISPSELLSTVSVDASPNANVIDITASSTDPELAARVANAFADQYIAFSRQTQIDGIDRAQRDLSTQLQSLPADSPLRADVEASIQRLNQLRAVAGADLQVIGRATPSSEPSGLSVNLSIALGALFGLAIGLTIAFIVESLNRRISSIGEFEREYGLPVLATVPKAAFARRRAADRGDRLEPYRILRAAVDPVPAPGALDTILVTSAVPAEGKTTVAIGLAQAIALTGRRVTLVELDLRRPTFGRHFELDDREGGVVAALTHELPAAQLLVEPLDDLHELSVLPSGALPPNPSELLSSPAVQELLTELADGGETTVVIDAPALNLIADTQVLLDNPCISTAIVVARPGQTTRDDVRRARAILDAHILRPLGLVIAGIGESGQAYTAPSARPTGARRRLAGRRPRF